MDISPLYQNKDQNEILAFIQSHAFGILVSQGERHPEATHVPYVLSVEDDEWYLYSHMSRNNRHTKWLSDPSQHLFIVQGVDHYISSTWYNHENVPTWNYLAVHLTGNVIIQEGAEALDNMTRLMDRLEPPGTSSRSMERLDPAMVTSHIKGLVAFQMRILTAEGAKKLSQNRDEANFTQVIRELEILNNSKATKMAEEMRTNNPFSSNK